MSSQGSRMKPVTAPARTALGRPTDPDWRERSGRLFEEFEGQAKAMVRRAFRGAFSPDELDDIYAGAWVGTLRALANRQAGLADDEIRSYVLTAVANQAGKEIRRRKRKPTAPLELVGGVADQTRSPEELATSAEQSRVARDVLASLPPRRRAVMLLRYGWGLEPSQVCGLVKGLSPRAYRKEITRGVDEVTERMRAVESGSWCTDREPVLKVYAAGLADAEQERQARAHLAHCRHCSEFVGRLSGHLHDLGGAVAAAGSLDAIDGHVAIGDRLADLGDRVGGLVARGGSGTGEGIATAGNARGAGAAGAGLLTKLAGIGTAGKILIACAGGGMAATACVAAGVAPFGFGGDPGGGPRGRRSTSAPSRIIRAEAPAFSARADPAVAGRQRVGPDSAARRRRRRTPKPTAPLRPRQHPRPSLRRRRPCRPSRRWPRPPRRPSRSSASRRRRSRRRARRRARRHRARDRAASTTRRAHPTCARSSGHEAGRHWDRAASAMSLALGAGPRGCDGWRLQRRQVPRVAPRGGRDPGGRRPPQLRDA